MPRFPLLGLFAWLALVVAAAALGGLASADSADFYRQLDRPDWAPPAWLFGPVWSALYLMMAVAAWMIWRVRGFRGAPWALTLFVVQLGLNALWTWLFFAWRLGALSLVEIVVLLALILGTLIAFWRRQRFAALLLMPYLLWVTFAAVLTYSLWARNPGVL